MEKKAYGIISYAGLPREALLAQAKSLFAQAQPAVTGRFDAFLPLFPLELVQNMDYLGPSESRGARVARNGFSIDPVEYHQKLFAQLPELYADDNYSRNFDYEGHYVGRSVFTVDRAWVNRFPQYQPFMGEKLMIHQLGGGAQAVAVPESIYPRGGGVLDAAEETLQVTQRATLYVQYAKARIAAGDRYDADAFNAGFLAATKQQPFMLTQKELGRILQDLSIVKSLQNEGASVGLYTENARLAERVNQYVPMRYACDQFSAEAVDKHTARLAQLYYSDGDFIADLWIPYQDVHAFVDKRTQTLNVRALCEGYQLAPRFDPETGGGLYPDAVRIAVVRDRDIPLMVGEVLNNPAYGDGMSPQGMIGRQAYIPDSCEMIRQRKLIVEDSTLLTGNLTLPPEAYRRSLALAVLQEHKGRLVDAMYRRETVLRQIDPDMPAYAKACRLLSDRVDILVGIVKKESAQSGMSQMSGYDADIDYLRRMQRDREGEPEVKLPGQKVIAFARDAQREQSIESGYAMRASLVRMMYADAALPEPPPAQSIGADESEDGQTAEPLPPIPSPLPRSPQPSAVPEQKHQSAPNPTQAAAPREVPPPENPPAGQPSGPAPAAGTTEPPIAPRGSGMTGADTAVTAPPGHPTAASQTEAVQTTAAVPPFNASTAHPGAAPLRDNLGDATPAAAPDKPPTPDEDKTAQPSKDEAAAEPGAEAADTASGQPAITADAETISGDGAADERDSADLPASDGTADADADAGRTASDALEHPFDQTIRHKRVSLRELSDRIVAETVEEPENPPPASAPEEPAKPKLAYILRRGSETAASKSYRRMAEMLDKRKP